MGFPGKKIMNSEPIEQTVHRCLEDSYRLRGNLERLAGENLNYLLVTEEGARFVVKIVGEDMPRDVVEMENAATEFALSAGFPLTLPKIIRNKFRNIETGIKNHNIGLLRLRLISFIEGNVLEYVTDISDRLLADVGVTVANYHSAMQGFDHPAAHRNHRWNLVEAGQHWKKTALLKDPSQRELMRWGFDTWAAVKDALKAMPWQFIHGDMNPENILVEGDRVSGLVDFGDACYNPVVCDLAICLTYMMMDRESPLEAMDTLVGGYQKVRPLSDAELSVLLPLVCGRLASSIAISTARRQIDPDNPNWFGSEDSAWQLLKSLRLIL